MEICIHCMQKVDDKFDICPYCGEKYVDTQPEINHIPQRSVLADRYIIGPAWRGSFGFSYKAWDTQIENTVVIQEFFPSVVNRSPGQLQVVPYSEQGKVDLAKGIASFWEETRIITNFFSYLNSENIYNFFEENGTAYFAMKYLEGISFKKYVNLHGGKIDTDTAVMIASKILQALSVIHGQGILYRNLSPDNILINGKDVVILYSFDSAKIPDDGTEIRMCSLCRPGYVPLEQYETKSKQGYYTDIYAVGACLYHAVTGIVPIDSIERVANIKKGKDGLTPPRCINPDIPKNLERIILKAMAIKPELRFQTTEEMLKALFEQMLVEDVQVEPKKWKIRRFFRRKDI